MLTPCESPSLLDNPTMTEVVNKLLINSKKLITCKDKHNALIKQIRLIEKKEQ